MRAGYQVPLPINTVSILYVFPKKQKRKRYSLITTVSNLELNIDTVILSKLGLFKLYQLPNYSYL